MRYGVLGSFEVSSGDERVVVGRPRRLALLGYLLLNANRFVSTEQVVDALWGERPPASARGQVHTALSELRKVLGACGGDPLSSRSGAYRLAVGESAFDVTVFRRFVGQARGRFGAGDPQSAARLVREGLALWRGEALTGVEAAFAGPVRVRLEEERFAAHELLADADLALGRHHQLVPELTALLDAFPTREGVAERLMLALFRSDRPGDALAVFARVRARLAQELGIDPGEGLRTLQQQILNADPALKRQDPTGTAPPTGRTAPDPRGAPAQPVAASVGGPAQLPAATADFTGRQAELHTLTELLEAAAQGRAPRVAVVSGMGGVGKTALAVQAAEGMSHRFPDGQLYVDLHGFGAGRPRTAQDVLAGFLADLDPSNNSAIPEHPEDRAALLRSVLAERRVLLLLDNAHDAAQVLPFLPGTGHCAVIVTTRNTLTDLPGALHLFLDSLDVEEQRALLSRLCGPERIRQDPDGAMRLLAACAGLPLALRIIGARLASRPAWLPSVLVERLDSGPGRMRELTAGQLAVEATFDGSYTAMRDSEVEAEREAARAFRLLGLWPGQTLGVEAAAALLDRPAHRAAELLEALVDVHLLQTPAPMRYRFHDLLGEYAAEQVRREEPAGVRAAALLRSISWYTLALEDAFTAMNTGGQRPPALGVPCPAPVPRFRDNRDALHWCRQELPVLTEAIARAAHGPRPDLAWRLAVGLMGYAQTHSWAFDWEACLRTALRTAREHADPLGQAWTLRRLGAAHLLTARYEESVAALEAALVLFEELGDGASGASVLGSLSLATTDRDRSLAYARKAWEYYERTGDHRGRASALNSLAYALLLAEDYQGAEQRFQQALALARTESNLANTACMLANLGDALRGLGRQEEAFAALGEALEICEQLGDVVGTADLLDLTGRTHAHFGQWQQARTCFERILDLGRKYRLPDHVGKGRRGLDALPPARTDHWGSRKSAG
ncbi:AfsR/SARP family transcriptional regulator [Streptomyces tateyamensis]|nr:BTAD domain-containing putative transcriptional regulator [Streptomyces tateyamensis]